MQMFTEKDREITGEFLVWYVNGKEINVYRTMTAAEAAVHRALRTGWSHDWTIDKDGSVLFLGITTGHQLKKEIRNAVNGLELTA